MRFKRLLLKILDQPAGHHLGAMARFLALAASLCAVAQAKLLIQKQAPGFELPAAMPDDSVKTVKLSDYKGKYVILFFYPFDFTFVCPTEIMAFNGVVDSLRAKGAEVYRGR